MKYLLPLALALYLIPHNAPGPSDPTSIADVNIFIWILLGFLIASYELLRKATKMAIQDRKTLTSDRSHGKVSA